jgi:flagellar assembly factor FliW
LNIDTKFFGEIEIQEKDIIIFESGLPGFEEVKRYILLDTDEQGILKCLQSVEYNYIAFIMANPWDVVADYEMDIDDGEIEELCGKDINNLLVYSILNITDQKMTANLMAPVLINTNTCQGKQIILYKAKYTTKHIIKEFAVKEE